MILNSIRRLCSNLRLGGSWRERRPARRDTWRLGVEMLEDRTLPAPLVSVLSFTPQKGLLFTGPVANFTDPGRSDPASGYSARIDWGDGSAVDTGTASGASGGQFTVSGSHTYGQSGMDTVTVTVTVTNTVVFATGMASAPIHVLQTCAIGE